LEVGGNFGHGAWSIGHRVRGQRSEIRGQLESRSQKPEFKRKAVKIKFFSTTGY
jgi:hypothetical protein